MVSKINPESDFIEQQQHYGFAQLTDFNPKNVMHQMHLARYIFASKFISPPCRVLDIACGIGYGSNQIASSCSGAEVIATDISEGSIIFGSPIYRSEAIHFIVSDGTRLPFEDAVFDYIVSIETIEHIPHHEMFLGELRRVLRPKGRIILTTPNREFTNPLANLNSKPLSRHHFREWRLNELTLLMGKFFQDLEIYCQIPVRHPIVSKFFTISRRTIGLFLPILRKLWVRWHSARYLKENMTDVNIRILQERFKVLPWNKHRRGRVIVVIGEKS